MSRLGVKVGRGGTSGVFLVLEVSSGAELGAGGPAAGGVLVLTPETFFSSASRRTSTPCTHGGGARSSGSTEEEAAAEACVFGAPAGESGDERAPASPLGESAGVRGDWGGVSS